MKQKDFLGNYFQIVSIVCSVMIIGLHSYNVPYYAELSVSTSIISSLSHGLFMSAVPIFFIMSGYLFMANANSLSDVFEKQKRRLLTLVVPFFAWSIFYYLFNIGVSIITKNGDFSFSFKGMLLEIIFYHYAFPLWFLFQLIVYVVFMPIVFLVVKKKASVILLVAFIILGIFEIKWKISVFDDERTIFAFNYFSYYFCGCWLCRHTSLEEILLKLSKINWAVIIITVVVLSVTEGILYETGFLFNKRLLVPFLAVAFMALLAKTYSTVVEKDNNVRIIYIPTMIVYGLHSFVLSVVSKGLGYVDMPLIINYFLLFLISTMITIAMSVVLGKIKVTNILLNGNRVSHSGNKACK